MFKKGTLHKGKRIKAYLEDSKEVAKAPHNEEEAVEESIAHGQGQTSGMKIAKQLLKNLQGP